MGVTRGRSDQDRVEAVERGLDALVSRYTPFIGLAAALLISPVVVDDAATWVPIGVLSAGAACWAGYFVFRVPARAERPAAGAVYVAGLLALMAALAWLSPFFGFLALAAYSGSFAYLPGRWRYLGLLVASAIVSYTYVGGRFAQFTPGVVLGYLVLVVVNTLVAGVFTAYGTFTGDLSKQRKKIIGELDAANARLSTTLAENAALHARLLRAAREAGVLDERARMAREIHDTLAQGLTGIVTQLEAADAVGDTHLRRQHLDTARALARESLTEARRSVEALAPGGLAGARLPDAIADMAQRWARTTRVDLAVETTGEPRPLLPDLEVALYRVAQEALVNAGKHAGASRVGLTLSYMPDIVVLDVRDDGCGFEPARPTPADSARGSGFGLAGMRQRLHGVSGHLAVESTPGEGTAVSASVPARPAGTSGSAR